LRVNRVQGLSGRSNASLMWARLTGRCPSCRRPYSKGQVVDFCAGQWPNFTPALTPRADPRGSAIESGASARHCSLVPYWSSNAGSLSPFWNCTLLRAIKKHPKNQRCSLFVPASRRLRKVCNQEVQWAQYLDVAACYNERSGVGLPASSVVMSLFRAVRFP
jgi:hypothetical protein